MNPARYLKRPFPDSVIPGE